jgi:hypothetical protein
MPYVSPERSTSPSDARTRKTSVAASDGTWTCWTSLCAERYGGVVLRPRKSAILEENWKPGFALRKTRVV